MSGAARLRAAGWYRDPADPAQLRHWNGRSWDARRRTLPAWCIATAELDADAGVVGQALLEGPVHPAQLPAAAAVAGASARTGAPPRGAGLRSGHPVVGLASRPALRRHRRWRGGGAPGVVAFALIGLVLAAVTVSVGVGRRAGQSATLSADTAFVHAADVACASDMGAVRTPAGAAVSPAGAYGGPPPAEVAAANTSLARLSTRISSLATTAAEKAAVAGWLAGWSSYAHDRARLASARSARQPGGVVAALGAQVKSDERSADAFAAANGLGSCTLVAQASSLSSIP